MNFKKYVAEKGLRLASNPKVLRLMQDERVSRAMMQAFQARGRVQQSVDQNVERVAKQLGLATKHELREMKRSMRKLETELKKTKREAAKNKKAFEEAQTESSD